MLNEENNNANTEGRDNLRPPMASLSHSTNNEPTTKGNGYRSEYTTSVGMAEHGWTKAAACKLLGDPDRYAVNPHYRSAPPMRLYRVERVLAKQNSGEFEEWMRGKIAHGTSETVRPVPA
jgi:hypothetical protein